LPDLRGHIVEHEVATFGAYDQDKMVFATVSNDFAQQQRTRWPSAIEKLVAFCHSIIMAFAATRVDEPGLAGKTKFVALGRDFPIDGIVDLFKVIPSFGRQAHGAIILGRQSSS
jgi:hypothetical protein